MGKKLIISVGGENKRMKGFIDSYFPNLPKHLLPLPTGKTIIEEIIENAKDYFDKIVLSASRKNYQKFKNFSNDVSKIYIEIDEFLNGPLGPFLRELLKTKKRCYGCAGDFYCKFSWKDFEKFHETHKKPISILVAPSISMNDGARFVIKNGIIVSWKRVKRTKNFDLINIGAYIIDPDPRVIKLIKKMCYYKEDLFFDLFIPEKMIAGYNPSIMGYNVNTPETYKKLCSFLENQT